MREGMYDEEQMSFALEVKECAIVRMALLSVMIVMDPAGAVTLSLNFCLLSF